MRAKQGMYRLDPRSEHQRAMERLENWEMCCDLGVRVHCVCRMSVQCPVHGQICVGTHD